MYVILVYDIKGEGNGQRVLNRTFKICKRYLSHIQNSVFEGELTESQLITLKYDITREIRKDLDSVIIFKSRNQRWLNKEMWGIDIDKTSNFL